MSSSLMFYEEESFIILVDLQVPKHLLEVLFFSNYLTETF